MLEGKKFWFLCSFLIFCLCSPFIFFCGPSMGCYQRKVDEKFTKNKEDKSARDWQLRLAGIFYHTLREKEAIAAYKTFWTRYPKDAERPFALERHAKSLQSLDMRAESIEIWKKLAREYPSHPLGINAREHLQSSFGLWSTD